MGKVKNYEMDIEEQVWSCTDLENIISQSEELGEDFTVMDWINEANKRKRVILYLQLL